MISRTLQEWNQMGYRVRLGEKMSGRDAKGVATFREDQVEYTQAPSYLNDALDREEEDEIPMDFASTQDSPPW